MSKLSWVLVIAGALLSSSAAGAADIHWLTNADDAWAATSHGDRPLLLFVTRPNCTFCTKMKATTFRDEQVVSQINGQFVPLLLDAGADPKFVADLGVRSFPTTLIISPQQGLIDQFKGYLPPDKLQARLTQSQRSALTARRPVSSSGAKVDPAIPAPPVPPAPPHLEPSATQNLWKPATR